MLLKQDCISWLHFIDSLRYTIFMKNLIKYIILSVFILVFSLVTNTVGATIEMGATTPTTTSLLKLSSSPTLKIEDTNPAVISLQQYLNNNGYIVNGVVGGAGSIGHETNKFGLKTKQALMKFQKDQNITPVDGIFGPKTKAKILEVVSGTPDTSRGVVLGASTSNYTVHPWTVNSSSNGHVSIQIVHPNNNNSVTNYTANSSSAFSGNVSSASLITLTAVPDSGYKVSSWSGDITECQDLIAPNNTACPQFTAGESSRNITVSFVAIPQHTLKINSSTGAGSGSVITAYNGVNYAIGDTVTYYEGETVTMSASPTGTDTFDSWNIQGTSAQTSTSNPLSVSYTYDSTINAVFDKGTSTLTVQTNGTGSGTVTSDPEGIHCGSGNNNCSKDYSNGTSIYLMAAASTNPNSTFDGWSGDCSGTGNCQLTMDYAKNVYASFSSTTTTSDMNTLKATTTGNGKGTIESDPPGIDCGNGHNSCQYDFSDTTTVNATATPAKDSEFKGFSGDCTGMACSFLMYSDKNISGKFTLKNASTSALNATTVGSGIDGTNPGVDGATYGTAASGTKSLFISLAGGHSTMFGYEDPTPEMIHNRNWDYNSYNNISGTTTFPLIPSLSIGTCTKTIDQLVAKGYTRYGIPAVVHFSDGTDIKVRIDDSGDDSNVCHRNIVDFYVPNYEIAGGKTGPYHWLDYKSLSGMTVAPLESDLTGTTVNSNSGQDDWEYRSRAEYDDALGWGVINSSPSGIRCGAGNTNCSKNYSKKQTVTLSKSLPKSWFVFSEWQGDCIGLNERTKKNSTCKVSMEGDKSVAAKFLAKYKKRQ